MDYNECRPKHKVCEPYFGKNQKMGKVKQYIDIAAISDCTVLILGETGTGKGIIARWIHEHSSRKNGEFVDINCAGLKGGTLKSELYGHVKGSFTNAISDHLGLIAAADGGTLFLDEIGQMDIEVQCQLLKTIENKTFRRIGENTLHPSDFRLICATSRNLPEAIQNGDFRVDLSYRINTLTFHLPSLNERREDIPGLAKHMLEEMGYSHPMTDDVAAALTWHNWYGNVRELRSVLERALIFAQGKILTLELISDTMEETFWPQIDTFPNQAKQQDNGVICSLNDLEEAHILRTLGHFGGDKNKASAALDISLSCLYRKLDKIRARDAVSLC